MEAEVDKSKDGAPLEPAHLEGHLPATPLKKTTSNPEQSNAHAHHCTYCAGVPDADSLLMNESPPRKPHQGTATAQASELTLKIFGMDCAEEVGILKSELLPIPGVLDLAFDVLNGRMTVRYTRGTVEVDELIAAVERTGMRAELSRPGAREQGADDADRRHKAQSISTAASALFMAGAFLTNVMSKGWAMALGGEDIALPLVPKILYAGAALTGAWYVLPKAWKAILRMRPDMNLLMTAAIAGAAALGQFAEAGTVGFLFAVSLLLESWSVGRARRAIGALMALTPNTARVRDAKGSEAEVDVAEVPVGSTVIVKPGEKFPLDGRVVQGTTTVNQAPITGESVPVAKSPGEEVFAGTINEDGAVEIVTSRMFQDTTLSRIIKMVGDAQSKRSRSEQWVEKFARYYTPAVMSLGLAAMALPPLIMGASWADAFYEGLVLLVIGCPCALVISTPVSIVAAMTSAARRGVLVKGGRYIEMPAHLKAIALDKTGTLTEGQPEVRKVIALSGGNERAVVEIAAAIEARSQHPLARAIERYAQSIGISPSPVDDFQSIKGKGATGTINGKNVWIGSHRYLEERGEETPEMHEWLEKMAAEGCSTVVIGENGHVCGLIAVGDRIRSNAKEAIAALKAAGVEHVVMLTGDNQATAAAVGAATGVDEVRTELLPEDKVAAVQQLVGKYGHVAMIGDGVNDAPAMAGADLGVAMGAAGTDAALETADIALMSDDLARLPWLVNHSKRTLSIIRQNIFASLAVKAAFVGLAFSGHASLWAAIAADMGVSLAVVANALRLLRR